jgi:hypothetical protein
MYTAENCIPRSSKQSCFAEPEKICICILAMKYFLNNFVLMLRTLMDLINVSVEHSTYYRNMTNIIVRHFIYHMFLICTHLLWVN